MRQSRDPPTEDNVSLDSELGLAHHVHSQVKNQDGSKRLFQVPPTICKYRDLWNTMSGFRCGAGVGMLGSWA